MRSQSTISFITKEDFDVIIFDFIMVIPLIWVEEELLEIFIFFFLLLVLGDQISYFLEFHLITIILGVDVLQQLLDWEQNSSTSARRFSS